MDHLSFLTQSHIVNEISFEPSLLNNHIHLWSAQLNQPATIVSQVKKVLSEDELFRFSKFNLEKDSNYHIIARGLLRYFLSRYLNISPSDIEFKYNEYGKPALTELNNPDNITFNLAHSHNLVVYAFAREQAVGVDIEYIDYNFSFNNIVQRFFSTKERQIIYGNSEKKQIEIFYQFWTRKEAYIKALEKGLSIPLNKFDVSQTHKKPIQEINKWGQFKGLTSWYIKDVYLRSGYAGSLAFEGSNWTYSYHQFLF